MVEEATERNGRKCFPRKWNIKTELLCKIEVTLPTHRKVVTFNVL